MLAAVIRDGRIEVEERPDPVPGPDEILIRVHAAGGTGADIGQRAGRYPPPPGVTDVPGLECAGESEDGERVMALLSGGGQAELAVAHRAHVLRVPEHLGWEEAGGFVEVFATAHDALFAQAQLREGERLLVNGAAGGVGVAAIQLAKLAGATVVATASSEEKRAYARDSGADDVRDYAEIDGLRVDVVIDPVGGDVFTKSLPLLNPLGTIVAIGFAGGLWQDPSVQWLVGRNAAVVGLYLGRLMKLRPDLVRSRAERLLELWRGGAIDPPVGAAFPLADARDAHALIEARKHMGKVVLEP